MMGKGSTGGKSDTRSADGQSGTGGTDGQSGKSGKSGKSIQQLARLLAQYARTRYRRKWRSRAAFERWQERQVLKRLRDVSARSPYYRELWGDRPLSEWRTFPLIDKAAMMANFDRLNTAGIRKDEAMELALSAERTRDFQPQIGDIAVGLSSGTSGSRGLFLVSEREQAAWAGAMLAKVLPGPLWRAERVAFFLRANNNLYESVGGGRLQFEYFDLLEPIAKHVERLNAYRPGIWAAPPSMLRLLAAEKRKGRLTALPHRILSVAEVLDPLDERFISDTMGLPVHQVYQCTEGFLACTCEFGTLHLNEDLVHMGKEYLPEGPAPIPHVDLHAYTHPDLHSDLDAEIHVDLHSDLGADLHVDFHDPHSDPANASHPGKPSGRRFVPIVTDFSRTTQPVIRYRLNDVLTEAVEPCPCGSVMTAIERIEGRCDDIFYLEPLDGGELTPVFSDYLARAVLAASPAIEEYRVIQRSASHMQVELLVAAGAISDKVELQVAATLEALWTRLRCRKPQLTFAPYSFQPGTKKLRRVERSWAYEGQRASL